MIAKNANISIPELINPKSQVFKKMNIEIADTNDEEAIRYIMDNPRILKRPILEIKNKVLFAFKESEYEKVI